VDNHFCSGVFGRHAQPFAGHAHLPIGLGILDVHRFENHPCCNQDQEAPEDVLEKVETVEERDAAQDESGSKNERAENAVVKDAMLCCGLDLKRAKDDDEEENVVDAEGFFYEVGGEEIEASSTSATEINPHIEEQRDRDPSAANQKRLAQLHHMRLAMHDEEVDEQQRENDGAEQQPSKD
jgi:hypothetical protein